MRLVLATLLTSSCGVDLPILPELPGVVSIEVEDDTGEIWAGFNAWNIAAGFPIFIQGEGIVKVIYDTPRDDAAGEVDGPSFDGRWITAYVSFAEWSDKQLVAAHEAGHVLGLGHTEDGIMYPITNDSSISPDDIARVRELYGL